MIDTSLEVEGLDDMFNQLNLLLGTASEKEVSSSLMFASNTMFKLIKDSAPVAAAAYFRYYRGSVKSRKNNDSNANRKLVEPGNLKKSIKRKRIRLHRSVGVGIYISSKAFYWRFIEYGTPTLAAVPFVRPAYDLQKAVAVMRFRSKFKQKIDAVIARQIASLTDEGDG